MEQIEGEQRDSFATLLSVHGAELASARKYDRIIVGLAAQVHSTAVFVCSRHNDWLLITG